MDKQPSDLITRLRDYCAKKRGSGAFITFGEARPTYSLLGGFLNSFAIFHLEVVPIEISLRCLTDTVNHLKKQYIGIKKSAHYQWDDTEWEWIDILLDSQIPEPKLIELIDMSYRICFNGLSHRERELIEFSEYSITPHEAIDYLIEKYEFSHHKKDILSLFSTHILMQTTQVDENRLLLGQSKIGGSPDLPIDWQIPSYKDKPLEFLAQINLSEIPIYMRDPLLPQTGILYFFSGFAWQTDEGYLTIDLWEKNKVGFSQVLYFNGDISQLKRYSYQTNFPIQSRSIVFSVMPSLDDDFYKVIRKQWAWDDIEIDKFFDLSWDFDELVNNNPQHQLLGHAQWIQNKSTPEDTRLLFQINSELRSTDLMWGDVGKIYFMIRHEDLIRHDFSAIYSEFQCY